MSTPDQPDTPQLTRRQLRELRNTASNPIITPEEAEQHPKSNVITRAIGASPDLLLASAEFELYADDMLLLCSDGLYREVSSDVLIKSLSSLAPEKAVKTLMQHALAGIASDNITAVVVRNN